ncbi:dipeptide/oligopeptide/nickel ABC transporter ATP-binding protein [Thermoproteus sp. CP80]|uniref:ABC transporter ATP-binding protein n=1 Tax=Thermoproteus sp. CP80 TaxID=1650659 RepID=UPI0009BF0B73|nr:ABC transporter ATP-binding protein [Thermoproteus sp. CP80]PLC61781.1 dipeptide/oligopeptide/nickel ABC transporter ATP-binding protein [Thermoproteus sp. CP80]
MPLLEVKGLKIYYFTLRGVVKAVDNVSFTLEKGESLAIVGESGSGKSTLGYGLIRLVPPPGRIVEGEIILDGTDLTKLPESRIRREIRWKRISMVFQGALNALNPVKRVGDQIVDAILAHESVTKKEALQRAMELLKAVGIDPRRVNNYPHEFSGGMKQRVVIAMALALNPDIVIADEPTTALDVVVQAQILNLLKKLKQERKMSIILITHDLSLVAELADKVAIMYGGKLVEIGSSDDIYTDPKHPYTKGLMASIPRLGGKKELYWIPGNPPDLRSPPPGCRFHPRCPYAMDICRVKEPPYYNIKDVSVACWLFEEKKSGG